MKFYAEPNHYVRITRKNLRNGRKSGFYFDENGVYETEDPRLIQALRVHFKCEDDNLPSEEETSALNEQIEAQEEEEEKKPTKKRR